MEKNISTFCRAKLNEIDSQLKGTAIRWFFAILVVYPFFLRRFSLFPDSLFLSLLQFLFLVLAIPLLACFSKYKQQLERERKKVLLWNQEDLKRSRNLSKFFKYLKNIDKKILPCTERVIISRPEDGEWIIDEFVDKPSAKRLEPFLGSLNLSHAQNYMGFGFGTIAGKENGSKDKDEDSQSHNIVSLLVLRNNNAVIEVLVPGPGANIQWLENMERCLKNSPKVPEDSHSYNRLKTLPFSEISLQDERYPELMKSIQDQVKSKDGDKQPVKLRGYKCQDNFIIATQISLGDMGAVSLYRTGFFKIFTEDLKNMGIIPQVALRS